MVSGIFEGFDHVQFAEFGNRSVYCCPFAVTDAESTSAAQKFTIKNPLPTLIDRLSLASVEHLLLI